MSSNERNTGIAVRMIAQLAALIFVTEICIMLALAGTHIEWHELVECVLDAGALTLIVSPITFTYMVKPFIRETDEVNRQLLDANEKSTTQARELAAALADLRVQKTILDNHCLVSRTDIKGTITYVNDEFCRLTGFSRDEMIGETHRIVNSGHHDRQFWRDMFGSLVRDGIWQGQICNRTKDGRLYWVQATNVADKDKDGRLKGYFSVRSDITETKKREQELAEAQIELRRAMEKAEAASESKSRFLSTMSHEMRTPLNGVIGAMELLKLEPLSERQDELVQLALKSSDALLVHINDVLDFSKLEAGKLELNTMPFNLRYLVKSVGEIISHRVNRHGNRLITNVTEGLPERFTGDPVRLRQILLNFASNAAKFTRNGEIEISALEIGRSGDASTIEFAVRDTGPGIPKNRLEDLFREFSMLDNSFARKAEGTGLGLAISKNLVEAMGGTIGVDSTVGKGSKFWIRIELKKTDEQIAGPDPLSDGGAQTEELTILLVDDNNTNRLVGSRLLESIGHKVELAASGREAVASAKARRFDVILMDVSMPEMDGIEATQHIRASCANNRETPIIALTAHAILGDRDRFMKAGMSEYLSKPLRLKDLQTRLATVLATGRGGHVERVQDPAPKSEGISLLDLEELKSLLEQTSPETVAEVVAEFLNEAPAKVSGLLEAVDRGDSDGVQKYAHALAGSSLSAGASGLGRRAKFIEEQCIAGKFAETGARCAELPGVLSDTKTAFGEFTDAMIKKAA